MCVGPIIIKDAEEEPEGGDAQGEVWQAGLSARVPSPGAGLPHGSFHVAGYPEALLGLRVLGPSPDTAASSQHHCFKAGDRRCFPSLSRPGCRSTVGVF